MAETPVVSLNPAGEDEWLRFRQHLELSDQFALIFVFSDRPAVAACFRERLASIHRARVTGLELPQPQTPRALLGDLLPRLLRPANYQQAIDAPIWLDLSRVPAAPPDDQTPAAERAAAWREARLAFLMRLNEQRESLRRTLTRPLILILPREEKADLRALCPDLWAIRQFTVETGDWLAPVKTTREPAAEPVAVVRQDRPSDLVFRLRRLWWRASGRLLERGPRVLPTAWNAVLATVSNTGHLLGTYRVLPTAWNAVRAPVRPATETPEPFPLTLIETALVLEWERLRDRRASDQGALLAADRAITVLVRRGRLRSAAEVAGWAVTTARGVIQVQRETPEALRDLSASLGNLGTLEQAAGHAQTAKDLLQEGLEIAERLAAALPYHVDYRELPAWFRQRL